MDTVGSKKVLAHSVCLEGRKKLVLAGVERVVSSSENAISLVTSSGALLISGRGLKISKFNVEDGSFAAEGDVDAIKYSGAKQPFLKKLFK